MLHDLGQTFFISGLKALGLISKFVSTPLWVLLERKDVSILEMNTHYLSLRTFLQEAAADTSRFMAGELLPFGEDVPIKKDHVYDALVKESSHDAEAAVILSVLLPALSIQTL